MNLWVQDFFFSKKNRRNELYLYRQFITLKSNAYRYEF